MMATNVAWAILAGAGAAVTAVAAVVFDMVRDWRYQAELQKRRNAEMMRWLDAGADWLYESSVDQKLAQR
jgi:hypothetical protein